MFLFPMLFLMMVLPLLLLLSLLLPLPLVLSPCLLLTTLLPKFLVPAHSVLHAHSNTHRSTNPLDDLASNGCADFDEFTAGCLFEDVVEKTTETKTTYFMFMIVPNLLLLGSVMPSTTIMNPYSGVSFANRPHSIELFIYNI